jgi:hypothetical protein
MTDQIPDRTPLDRIAGSGKVYIGFEEIDLRYRLKMRAFIGACMPPIFADLERQVNMRDLRRQGIASIMFYLRFENTAAPLVFNSRLESRHSVWLRRSVTPDAKARGGKAERLMLDMEAELWGRRGTGDPRALGTEAPQGEPEMLGRMRGLHVITRPVGPPGERQVTEVPAALRVLKEHPFDEPFPTPERVCEPPAGYAPHAGGPWEQDTTVWGLPNTDINQHVNVKEYIFWVENLFSRLLFSARLPVAEHRIAKAELLFRKPFFPGTMCVLRGKLYTKGQNTVLLATYHPAGPEGQVDERPSVAVRMEGAIEPAPAGAGNAAH